MGWRKKDQSRGGRWGVLEKLHPVWSGYFLSLREKLTAVNCIEAHEQILPGGPKFSPFTVILKSAVEFVMFAEALVTRGGKYEYLSRSTDPVSPVKRTVVWPATSTVIDNRDPYPKTEPKYDERNPIHTPTHPSHTQSLTWWNRTQKTSGRCQCRLQTHSRSNVNDSVNIAHERTKLGPVNFHVTTTRRWTIRY